MSHSDVTIASAFRHAVNIRNSSAWQLLPVADNWIPDGELLPRLSVRKLSGLFSKRLTRIGWFAAMYLLSVLSFGALVGSVRWTLSAIQAV